jgi:hypothetical protein
MNADDRSVEPSLPGRRFSRRRFLAAGAAAVSAGRQEDDSGRRAALAASAPGGLMALSRFVSAVVKSWPGPRGVGSPLP